MGQGKLNSPWYNAMPTGKVRAPELLRFLVAFAIAYGANLAVLFAAEGMLGADNPLAQLPAIAAYVVIFFLLSQFVVFRPAAPE